MASTIKGIMMAMPTHKLGVASTSLKRHMAMLIRAAMITASVPAPTPKISPSYISLEPVEETVDVALLVV